MDKALKVFAILTTIGMLLVLLMGAIVTKTGSGEGCGNSWPLCYGEILPTQPELETMIEYSHRLVSATLGIMVIILAIWTWIRIPHLRETKLLAILSVFFIVLQGLLGAAAVIWSQSSAVLALHFGFSLLSFASVLLLTILCFENPNKPISIKASPLFKWNIYFLFIYLYIVVYTGALVRHVNASLACSEWPLCNGSWAFPDTGQAAIQYVHRLAAGLLFIWILMLLIKTIMTYRNQAILYRSVTWLTLLILLQVTSGALIIFTELNLFIALFHGLFISLLFGVLSYLVMVCLRPGI
jgi:cytochrome c oxidase assembly protein subunit 15